MRWLSALLLGSLVACTGVTDDVDVAGAALAGDDDGFGQEAERLWTAYVDREMQLPLQEDCSPRRIAAKKGVRRKGTVVLLHGYSACPQQFFDVSKELSADGYDVLLPLLPGQGRDGMHVQDHVIDRIDGIPVPSDAERYGELARTVNAIMRATHGEKVIGGLSVGGAVATAAVVEAPDLYDRALMMSPFYDTGSAFGRLFAPIANLLFPEKRMGRGEPCEFERSRGRAGYCTFKVENAVAARNFGRSTVDRIDGVKGVRTDIQFAGVESDGGAFNGLIVEAAESFPAERTSSCFFEQGTDHSFLSPFDNPRMDKFWMPVAQEQVVAFLANGTRFVTVGPSPVEKGSLRCKTRPDSPAQR